MSDPIKERVCSKVQIDDDCWLWTGCVQANGYARLRFQGTTMYAHRASYLAFNGPIPAGKDVCHKCDRRHCVNPGHLFLGSRADNMQDAQNKGRLSRGDAHAAKISGSLGPGSKLQDDQVLAIRRAAQLGVPAKDLATLARVDVSNVRLIINHKTWKHI